MKYKFSLLDRYENSILGAIGLLIFIFLWFFVTELNIINPIFISSPFEVFSQGFLLFKSGFIYEHLATSLYEFIVGFGLASISGVILGFILGWFRKINAVSAPLIYGLYVVPIAAVLPLIVIWFGVGFLSKVAIIFLASVFPILINISDSVKNVDEDLLRLAKSFKASNYKILTTIVFPYCFPSVITGIKIAIPRGIIGMILAEFFLGSSGLGFLISYYGATFQTARLLSVVFILIIISVFINFIAGIIEKKSTAGNYRYS